MEPEVSANVFVAGEQITIDPSFPILDIVDKDGDDAADEASNQSNNNDSGNNANDNRTNDDNRDDAGDEADRLSLRQAGVKVGASETESVIHVVSKLGAVSLAKKEWFGAFKFGK